MILQKFVGNVYSVFVEILLWLIPIAGFVAAGITLGSMMGRGSGFQYEWAFLGLLGGFILDVILFGPLILLFNIRASLKNLENR
jgi:hypothetical protein